MAVRRIKKRSLADRKLLLRQRLMIAAGRTGGGDPLRKERDRIDRELRRLRSETAGGLVQVEE